jgi:hypothetical protein
MPATKISTPVRCSKKNQLIVFGIYKSHRKFKKLQTFYRCYTAINYYYQ